MTRDQALKFVQSLIKNSNLFKHHLAAEACMRGLARFFQEDEEKWGLVGLLHDADYELVGNDAKNHTLVLKQKLDEAGLKIDEDIFYSIQCHNKEALGIECKTKMDWAIFTCDELSGFIIACTLVHPSKKLASIDSDFVLRRLKEPSFARNVRRDWISQCETTLNIPLPKFVKICLGAMQEIHQELGL